MASGASAAAAATTTDDLASGDGAGAVADAIAGPADLAAVRDAAAEPSAAEDPPVTPAASAAPSADRTPPTVPGFAAAPQAATGFGPDAGFGRPGDPGTRGRSSSHTVRGIAAHGRIGGSERADAAGQAGPSNAGIDELLDAVRAGASEPATEPGSNRIDPVADLTPDPSPLNATAPTTSTSEVTAAGDPAGARPAGMVTDQLVDVIRPLRHDGHGRYDLRVDLHPADLGRVRLDVTFEAGVVHVTLHADQGATNQLLQQSLGDLRQALEQAGVATGQLAMGAEGSAPGSQDRPPTSGPSARPTAPGTPEASPVGPTHRIDGGVDVLL
jgi:hypothetical protein